MEEHANALTAAPQVSDGREWTVHIKTVNEEEPDFTILLSPDDPMSELHERIRAATGLTPTRQRLIYRGRLLNETAKLCVKDIVGLKDGHTIHLVRKQEQTEEAEAELEPESPSRTAATGATSSLLSALLGSGNEERRSRRVPYRLSEEDLLHQDPGSVEPVRQSLMTLHTMFPSTETQFPNRRFYRGQWIDCRDTVNAWLEATVVQIVAPHELLPPIMANEAAAVSPSAPSTDPAVAFTDLEGRRRLLLEPCEAEESEEQIDGIHYRRRDCNNEVQILHVHYNGWPVRWDEWIRSDSERIRPFRVRTRHPTSSPHISPTVQASMQNPPNTQFSEASDEAADRQALLPELLRVFDFTHLALENATANNPPTGEARNHNLPWQGCDGTEVQTVTVPASRRRRELERLAPLLDRLGRAMTDASLHVAALAASIDDDDDSQLETIDEHPSTLEGLLSLLSRDRRRHGQSVSSSAAVPSGDVSADVSASLASSTTGGNELATMTTEEEEEEEEEEEAVLPDHTDFASGIVNTTRGEVRTGPRANRNTNSDELAGFLGAYLAAASLSGGLNGDDEGGAEGLGRLLRDRGNGGIDIHIHAVVTADGGGGNGVGIANGAATLPTAAAVETDMDGNGGGLTTLFASSPRERRTSRRLRTSGASLPSARHNHEDDGIFSELYSETPDPINHNSPSRSPPEHITQRQPSQESAETTQLSVSGARLRSLRNENEATPSAPRRRGVLGRLLFRRGDSNT